MNENVIVENERLGMGVWSDEDDATVVRLYGDDPAGDSWANQGWIELDRASLEWLRDAAIPAALEHVG